MRGPIIPLLFSVFLIAVLVFMMGDRSGNRLAQTTLLVHCAAGIRPPVEEAAKAYEEEFGVTVQFNYAGSGALLSSLKTRNQGDIYIAADSSYTDLAREAGIVSEALPVATQRPTIAVPKGNPKGITGIDELLKDGIRIAFANPDAASVGKTSKKLLTSIGKWQAINDAVTANGVFKPTVNEVANDVKLGTVDAGIIWNVTVNQYPELEAVPLENADNFAKNVTIGIMTQSKQPAEALRFARYLTAPEKGIPIFKKYGFPVIPGDTWTVNPEILYYSGGVNRIAIEETLAKFQKREGVSITTVYNGCGILLGQIKTGGRPDLYHTCDISFMNGVEEHFGTPLALSKTQIVILVPKGNPRNIQSLRDLTLPSLQLGLCNEEQSTLGSMTADLLHAANIYEAVQKNVVVNTPTADLLTTQLSVGKLDAAVVYQANAMQVADVTDTISINQNGAVATQTIAIAQTTKYPAILTRLNAALQHTESRERFLQSGFEWISQDNAS
ncbi:MAG: molybdate ABC transporter substrate-binding protein [Candidatus Hydrogenedentota bacterium]